MDLRKCRTSQQFNYEESELERIELSCLILRFLGERPETPVFGLSREMEGQ